MKTDRIFVGDIMQCVECREEVVYRSKREESIRITKIFQTVKENAVLIAMKNGLYIDIEDINMRDIFFDSANAALNIPKGTEANYEGEMFVDEKSLQPYTKVYGPLEEENIGVFKLKKLVRN